MKKKTIRVILSSGEITETVATVTEWIDNDGQQTSTADDGDCLYRPVDRDSHGVIYGAWII